MAKQHFNRGARDAQFDLVADVLNMPANDRPRVKYPKRAFTVAVPVRMDSGEVKVFAGYRVQHHLSLGPTKGGIRFDPARAGMIHRTSIRSRTYERGGCVRSR